jgi:hypothetical protein
LPADVVVEAAVTAPPSSLSLRFQAGVVARFIHWRVAAERRDCAGDFVLT